LRFTLDANILVYAVDRDEPRRHAAARSIVARAARGDCVLTLQALGEFVHAAHRKRRSRLPEIRDLAVDWAAVFPLVAAAPAQLSEAIRAVEADGMPFWDAMLWATAKRAGCRFVLTEDFQDGRKLGGVTFLDPFNADNGRVLDALLPAD
jgi:predicted nucleic acid-binding protein